MTVPRLAVLAAAWVISTTAPALAQSGKAAKAPAPACGVQLLPLVAGNTWTYRSGPTEVVVTVVAVTSAADAAGRPVTRVQVQESAGGQPIATEWTCTPATGLRIAPESLLFAAESSAGTGTSFHVTAREGVTIPPDAALVPGAAWVEKLAAEVSRADAASAGSPHPPAKVEVERHVRVHGPDPLTLNLGQFAARKLTFELRGRALVGDEKVELPAQRQGAIWLVRGLGVVMMDDAINRTWELASTNVPLPR